MGKMKKVVFCSQIILTAAISSCKKDNPVVPPPPEPPKTVTLSLVDVSCTEAFIKVAAADSVLPVHIILTRDDNSLNSFNLTQSDTVIIDTTLQPNTTYTYQTSAVINGEEELSDTLQVHTLRITSDNFNWQTYTFGDPQQGGSSELNDVAIIDENNIWAVGEIYIDTTGMAYNAVHWDGNKWDLKRLKYYGNCSGVEFPPLKAIWAYSDSDIVITNGGSIGWFNGDTVRLDCGVNPLLTGAINKIWGFNKDELFVVGNNGSLAHYKNNFWTKIETGTTTNINDIWGYYNPLSNHQSVICVASNIFQQGEIRLLAISDNSAQDTLNYPYTDWMTGVWFKNQYSPVYICGDGFKQYKDNIWSEINIPGYFTEAIRGSDYNNIFVVGDFGIAAHFNGISWQTLDELFGIGKFLAVSVKNNTVVMCGHISSGGIVGKAMVIVGKEQ